MTGDKALQKLNWKISNANWAVEIWRKKQRRNLYFMSFNKTDQNISLWAIKDQNYKGDTVILTPIEIAAIYKRAKELEFTFIEKTPETIERCECGGEIDEDGHCRKCGKEKCRS